jgi:hypothetical protein
MTKESYIKSITLYPQGTQEHYYEYFVDHSGYNNVDFEKFKKKFMMYYRRLNPDERTSLFINKVRPYLDKKYNLFIIELTRKEETVETIVESEDVTTVITTVKTIRYRKFL